MTQDILAKEKELAKNLRKAVATKKKSPGNRRALIGLDGFIDEIVHVVDIRKDHANYVRLENMADFAKRIDSFAGKSGNIEYVSQRVKIGGNGPIMANAISSLGVFVTYIGNLGWPDVHQVFKGMEDSMDVVSLAAPCHTDAVEFVDGKIMFGKMLPIFDVTWDRLMEVVGKQQLTRMIDTVHLLALVNWSMITGMNDIWEKILDEICPNLYPDPKRYAFFDLADPQKRDRADVKRMLELMTRFSKYYRVIFGMNLREAIQVAEVLKVRADPKAPDYAEQVCNGINAELGIYSTVVHPVEFAVCTIGDTTFRQEGPHTSRPVITTGAGDHFNAAFCLGQMLDMDARTSLLMGVCCSGFYVMTGKTPTLNDLVDFMDNWRDDPFNKMG